MAKRILFPSTPVLPTIAVATILIAAPGTASACGTEAYTGQVCTTVASYCPANTAEATGQLLSIEAYTALYALVGCTFGGDCRSSFALPDLRGRTPVQYGQGPGLTERPFGRSFGQESVTQTVETLAPHTHTATFTASSTPEVKLEATVAPADSPFPTDGSYLGISLGGDIYASAPATMVELGGVSGQGGTTGKVVVNATGDGTAIPTVPPEIALRYCVVLEGIFPPRS